MLREQILSTRLAEDQIAVFYLGQEGFLFKYHEKYLLIDPYLSDYVDQNCSNETTLWKRSYPAPIDASELSFIDYVFCTHDHYDHADPETLSKIAKVNSKVKFIVPAPIKETIISYGIPETSVISAKADTPFMLDDFQVTPVPAAHEELQPDADGLFANLCYLIQLDALRIFHAGDCCVYEGLKERLGQIDIAFLPINGRDYYRYHNNIIGNMDSTEAIWLAKEIHAELLVPMHFDLYDVNEVNPGYFTDRLFKLNRQQRFHIFAPGERYIYE